ncbi:aldo/keto reductase, partial [Acidobacteriota bacterium]
REEETRTAIKDYRILGRTGFKVSDIALGGTADEAGVLRYAFEKGINYIDTAEVYGNGKSEERIGQALKHVDRKKIFITTKLIFPLEETQEKLLERFNKCQERLNTPYVDALYIHLASDVKQVKHEGFHAAVKRLKSEGRLKHAGLSCHGDSGQGGQAMEKVLGAACEDGRFDLMLFVYNFMHRESGERILKACRDHNIGTTIMKTAPGAITIEPLDPDNLTEEYEKDVKTLMDEGMTRQEAIDEIREWIDRQNVLIEKARPFREKHGAQTNRQLKKAALQWVLANPDVHTVCMRIRGFDDVDEYVPISGTRLSQAGTGFLEEYRQAFNHLYCRHGCRLCAEHCAHKLPVSTIMRYSYYFYNQGREKEAMTRYARLKDRNGSRCMACTAPCDGACPYGVDIKANLLMANALLRLA